MSRRKRPKRRPSMTYSAIYQRGYYTGYCKGVRERPLAKPNRPNPFAFTTERGGVWRPFDLVESVVFHAILFDDGTIFDADNGWRRGYLSPEWMERITAAMKQRSPNDFPARKGQ